MTQTYSPSIEAEPVAAPVISNMTITPVGGNIFSLNIRGMDRAGADWVEMIATALREKNRIFTVLFPPNELDRDEAFVSGWWPIIS